MKRLLLVLLVAVFAIPTFQSCKKGENDPSISLRSRKARLVAEWELKEGSITTVNGGTTVIYTFNGTTMTSSLGGSVNYTQTCEIVKDGTFKLTILDDGDSRVDEGQWYFLEGNKDKELKSKEAVAFVVTKRTDTPAGGSPNISTYVSISPDYMWQLDELKNKEIIVKTNEVYTGGSTNSTTGTLTYTSK
jgi:hypothetical protein